MYLDDKEKEIKISIDNRIAMQNDLEVSYYISDGNRVDIFAKGKGILCMLTFEQAYYVVHGICNYMEV